MENKLDKIIELLEEINSKIKSDEKRVKDFKNFINYLSNPDDYLKIHGKPPKRPDDIL